MQIFIRDDKDLTWYVVGKFTLQNVAWSGRSAEFLQFAVIFPDIIIGEQQYGFIYIILIIVKVHKHFIQFCIRDIFVAEKDYITKE